ncbi:hypothetical protein [Hydrogenimonas sp.]
MKSLLRMMWLLVLAVGVALAALHTDSLQQAADKKIAVSPGVAMKIPKNINKLFVQTSEVSRRLKSLRIRPKIVESVRETSKQVIFVRKVTFDLKRPGEYDKIFGTKRGKLPKRSAKPTLLKGDPVVGDRQLDKLVTRYKKRCKPTDKLCKLSKNELKKLFANKTGTFVVEEKVVVNKKPAYVDVKKLQLRLPSKPIVTLTAPAHLSKHDIVPIDYSKKARLPKLAKKLDRVPGVVKENMKKPHAKISQQMAHYNPHLGGTASVGKKFLNGFTLGGEYSYTYRERYKKGGKEIYLVELWAYLGAGIGLRLPYEMLVRMGPERLEKGSDAKVSIYFEAKDFTAKEYREVGLPNYQVFDGKEFVLRYGAQIGAKLKVLGETVFDSALGKKVDNSRDFTTPLGGERAPIKKVVLHGKDIGLYYGNTQSFYVEGNLRFDLFLVGEELRMKLEGYHCRPDITTLHARKREEAWPSIKLKEIGRGITERSHDDYGEYVPFGIVLKKPEYESDIAIDTLMSMRANINCGKWIGWKHVDTPWLHVYTFELDMPTLDAHSGTVSKIEIRSGRYYDKKEQSSSQSSSNHKKSGNSHHTIGPRPIKPASDHKKIPPINPKKITKEPAPIHGPVGH